MDRIALKQLLDRWVGCTIDLPEMEAAVIRLVEDSKLPMSSASSNSTQSAPPTSYSLPCTACGSINLFSANTYDVTVVKCWNCRTWWEVGQ